ncbi:MAG: NADH-quinone oxidoreductase subunit M [Deltaproteobacteria bacterium]|nr:NADH-quinone oxidoreductase subunit M [Deltaproteobacteria bacterium]
MSFENHLLTLLIFLPLCGALLLCFLPKSLESKFQSLALLFSLLEFILSLFLLRTFDSSSHLLQFAQKVLWIPSLGISFFVGIDGMSLWLILLTTFLTPLVIFSSTVGQHIKGYMACFLILETAMIGTFVSLDLFLFYIFWELMLVPMYFIIGIWGNQNRIYATLKFFIYTLAGGVCMLLAILFLVVLHYDQFGTFSTSLLDMYSLDIPFHPQALLFLAFALAFLIKIPSIPFHTWLPDAHVEAPTGGSVILAGVLLKMGIYGFLRFAIPLFPNALHFFTPFLVTLALAGVIYGAFLALAQKDLKKLVAYSSISHMGLILLGLLVLNSHGLSGSVFQMLSHGLSTGALFLMVGMIYDRRHTKEIALLGGLTKVMPVFSVFFLIITLASIALPSTNGFIGEFLILIGAFEKNPLYAILGGTSVVLGAYYMLWMIQRVLFGPIQHEENKVLQDLSWKEIATLIPIVIFIFWMGLYPKPFFQKMEKSLDYLAAHYERYDLGIYEKKQ